MSETDFKHNPFFDPPWHPGQRWAVAIDAMSWVFPALAAALSIGGGVTAWNGLDKAAAALGIGGGIASAAGVYMTNLASRIRDGSLRLAHAKGDLGIQMAEWAQRGPVDTLG